MELIKLKPLKSLLSIGASIIQRSVVFMSTTPPPTLETSWTYKKTWKYPIRDTRRCYFPRPKETKRAIHNFDARMQTSGGRRVLMRRILKGCHYIAH